ncbi:MAG TPA: hypothetical protein DD415_05025 [Clostridiales bacterium]|nr:hypothetical protein [Clostridiales bacterium]
MLEIKNVTKVYKTKGGVDTKALDDVSIAFPETGLVFLLGKSGSGKSTLLNVCGGLDEPTSGEVIVKGKSSKSFSGSDFDSYRNTFVGFIFQEYNVLDEFNVEDNIALALELQGKPKDKEKIHKLLCDVELENFAKRKPNTLSGGQKQRIAIARALVKEPQIIMADEPTGALDSATGKQVFDTLKKLSETRLVIVVSHDREFAEIYGDRIVELKDGKIISDVTKANVPPQTIDENVTVIGGNTLNIKKGSRLNKDNIKAIQDFVLSCDGDVIITKGEKQIDSFKKANRMAADGATETFGDTNAEDIELKQYSKEDSKFIRSRLPAGKAIKIGASGLKLKPVRLIFTIFLSFIAFTMFGLFSTLMVYDGDSVAKNSFMESGYEFINLTKQYATIVSWGDNDTYESSQSVNFTQKEVDEFAKKFGDSTFGYYSLGWSGLDIDNVKANGNKKNEYYKTKISKLAYLSTANTLRNNITAGKYPEKATEICISRYLAEGITSENTELYKVVLDDKDNINYDGTETVTTVESLVGKYLVISLNGRRFAFKITGVFDSGNVSEKYDKLKQETDGMLEYQYEEYLKEGMFQLAFVSENFYSEFEKYGIFSTGESIYIRYFDYCENQLGYKVTEWDGNENNRYLDNNVKAFGSGDNTLKCHFLGGANKTSLAENEVVLSLNYMTEIMRTEILELFTQLNKAGEFDDEIEYPKMLQESDKQYEEGDVNKENGYYDLNGWHIYDYEDYKREYQNRCEQIKAEYPNVKFDNLYRDIEKYLNGRYYNSYEDENGNWQNEEITLSKEERLAALDNIVAVFNKLQPIDFKFTVDELKVIDCKLVGFHERDIESNNNDSDRGMYLSQSFIDKNLNMPDKGMTEKIETNYVKEEGTIYGGIYVEYDKQAASTDNLFAAIGRENKKANDVFYEIENSLYQSIEMANNYAEMLSTIFLWVGVVFAAFAALLMFNFISMSISNKRKEIGILRAVGARGTDVFKIFFAEAGIISGICTILSIIGAVVGCWLINGILKSEIGLEVTLFVFGIASVAMMLGIALLVAFISTFLPVYFAARKKPVDSIRAL